MRIREIVRIVEEATSFNRLSDAGPNYAPGETQIWYTKDEYFRDLSIGYESLEKLAPYFDPDDLEKTHVLLGTLAISDPDQIFSLMISDIWSPNGEARELIRSKGLGHTSMSVGDIIATPRQKLIVDNRGFIDLYTGREPESNNDIEGESYE